ncbi:MAG: haloacid dehalogenase type II, partial [Comamonadaceae bacterium]
ATHHDDLEAARACGLRTAYIERPHELGAARPKNGTPQPGNDLHCANLLELARILGC